MSEQNRNINETEAESVFDEPTMPKITAKTKHKSDAKRQLKVMLTSLLVVAVGLAAYFFVIKPLVEAVPEAPPEEVVLLDGEVIGPQNRIFIMEYIDKNNVSFINVHNEYGEYGITYDEETENYTITDDPSAGYDREKLQSLLSAAGYTLAMERITDSTENFGEFGLSELDNPAWYEIGDRNGKTHKLYIGDIIPSNAGYYVRYDGRDAVYVLDSTISETLLSPLEAIISPTLAFPVPQNAYHTIVNFYLFKGEAPVVAIEAMTEETKRADGSVVLHKFLYPEQYVPNESRYLEVFSLFCDYKGMSTLKYNPTKEDIEKYGLDTPEFDLYFEYNSIPNNILFSEKTTNSTRYAYSPIFNVICEVSADKVAFLDYKLIDWIERPVMQVNIASVTDMIIESEKGNYHFTLEFTDETLTTVREKNTFTTIADIDNFRKFYQTILMTTVQDNAELTAEQISELEAGGAYLTLTVVMKNGDRTVRKFYPYETRRSFYTIDGKGDFYVIRDRMVKIVDDAEKAVKGITIYPDANS